MTAPDAPIPSPFAPSRRGRIPGGSDRIFTTMATGAGVTILLTLAGVAIFLLIQAWPAFTATAEEVPGEGGLLQYIWPLLFGTLLSATLAIIVAVPASIAVALFITQYAPRRLAEPLP